LRSGSNEVAPLAQCLRHGCGVGILQFAAHRQTARDAADLEPARMQQFGEVMRGRLALVGEIGGENDFLDQAVGARENSRSKASSFGPMPSSGESRPIST
jgi:hypothetical protein